MKTTATKNLNISAMTDAVRSSFTPTLQASIIKDTASPITMSSLEIAAATGKRHPHVMRDIIKMLNELGEGDASKFGSIYLDAYNREKPCYKLPRREVDILLTGYSMPLRALVFDHFAKHEDKSNKLKAFHCQVQLDTLKYQIEENSKKVALYDKLADTTQLFGVSQVAKTLGTGQKRLFAYMRNHKILSSKRYQFNEPYQKHQEAGRFEVKWADYKDEITGEILLKPTAYFTGKGVIWIEAFISKHGRDGLK